MPIPWDKVILHGPQVLDAAKHLYSKWQSRPRQEEVDPNEELKSQLNHALLRVKALEEAQDAQAKLAEQLAEQTQALATGISALKLQLQQMEKLADEIKENRDIQNIMNDKLSRLSSQIQEMEVNASSLHRREMLSFYFSVAALIAALLALATLLLR